jgi:hypothetical protein
MKGPPKPPSNRIPTYAPHSGRDQRTLKFSADVLPLLETSSNSMACPSLRFLRPVRSTAEYKASPRGQPSLSCAFSHAALRHGSDARRPPDNDRRQSEHDARPSRDCPLCDAWRPHDDVCQRAHSVVCLFVMLMDLQLCHSVSPEHGCKKGHTAPEIHLTRQIVYELMSRPGV